ncbi:MAG TPA: hypothetical protein VHY91_19715 [Pirellulales bacterium]|nr:hypothetical protein [Pirellulales bacterium]
MNLANHVAIIASGLWLLLVAVIVRTWSRSVGGLRPFLIDSLGELAGRRFVAGTPNGDRPAEIRFGFDVLGRRFVQRALETERIESVSWSSGQATAFAGRDMKDWSVFLTQNHNGPPIRQSDGKPRDVAAPHEYLWSVGLARRQRDAENLALLLVALLIAVGVGTVRRDGENRFVRDREYRLGDKKWADGLTA